MVLIAGHIGIRAIANLARRVRGPIPDRFAFAICVPCAFHLVSGGGHAPKKILGKTRGGNLCGRYFAGNLRLSGRLQGCNLFAGKQSAAANDQRVLEKASAIHWR